MRFLIDVDEVLADFVNPAVAIIERVLGRPWSFEEAGESWDMFACLEPEQNAVVQTMIETPSFCRNLQPKKGARAFVDELKRLLDGNVYACTASHDSPHWTFERDRWLDKHMAIDRDHIVHAQCKYVCSGDFFLDDNPDHVIPWQAEHLAGVGMLWTTEHNARLKGNEDIRVRSFEAVLHIVEERLRAGLQGDDP